MSIVKSTIGFLVLIIIDEGCGQTLQVGTFPDYLPAGERMTRTAEGVHFVTGLSP